MNLENIYAKKATKLWIIFDLFIIIGKSKLTIDE